MRIHKLPINTLCTVAQLAYNTSSLSVNIGTDEEIIGIAKELGHGGKFASGVRCSLVGGVFFFKGHRAISSTCTCEVKIIFFMREQGTCLKNFSADLRIFWLILSKTTRNEKSSRLEEICDKIGNSSAVKKERVREGWTERE